MRVLTIFLASVFSNGQEYFNITRQSSSLSEDFPDIVQLSPSECGDSNDATNCSTIGGGITAVDCQCTCNENDDRIQYKGTFGFLEGQWKCQNNTVVRKHAECLLSEDEQYDPIRTISSRNHVSSSSLLIEIHFTFVVKKFVADNASFLGCDGEWAPLDGATIRRSFHLTSDGKSISVNKSLDLFRLGGLIIRLAVDSYNYTSIQCVLFKIAGHQICPLSSQSSSLPLPSSSNTTLHIILIATLLGASVLVVVVTVAVLMTKSRRVRRRQARQPFVMQMSSLEVTENNEYTDESFDAIEIDQSHDVDGYLHPFDEVVPRGKEHESKRLSARELNAKRQVHAHMKQQGHSNTLQDKNINYNNHCSPRCKMKSTAKTLDDVFEPSPRDGSPRYKDSQTSLNEPYSSCPKQSKAENEKRSTLEHPYYVLEAPTSYSADTASEQRHNTLPNLRNVAMETNREINEYVVNEAEQVMTRYEPRRENNYEELHFDDQQCSSDYQQLCYVTRKKEEE